MAERLQKVLSQAGVGSRRQVEEWIRQKRITINGCPAVLGDCVQGKVTVRLDDRIVLKTGRQKESIKRILIYHKPEGEVCTRHDEEGRPTVFRRLPKLNHSRWVMVGRLDLNSQGLLLFTEDGQLAHRLMHPSSEIEREYRVRVKGEVTDGMLRQLQTGVMLDDGEARFDKVTPLPGTGSHGWYQVVLHEGRNREVRRLWASQDILVSRLLRVRYGPVVLPRELRTGHWRECDDQGRTALYQAVGMTP